jgi:aconitate hydratase
MPKPAKADRLGKLRVSGAPPILVIGNTGDPATPYAGAQATVARIPIAHIHGARALVYLGDSVTTDHISPAGAIGADSAAGRYLIGLGVPKQEFNSYGSRRGNDRVMTRGTFANTRIKNRLAPGTEGGFYRLHRRRVRLVYEASLSHRKAGVPPWSRGKDYGMIVARLGGEGHLPPRGRAVIAESFEHPPLTW